MPAMREAGYHWSSTIIWAKDSLVLSRKDYHTQYEIAQSNSSLDTAIDHITKGVGQVSQVVQENSAVAEQSAASSEAMNSQSEILQNMVAQFKLKNPSQFV